MVTSDRPSEVVYRGSPGSIYGIAALDNTIYIATDDGILREDGEMFIPTPHDPAYFTASNGYLYWTQPARSGGHTIYASLGELNTAREVGFTTKQDARLVAARGGVTVTPQVQALSIWSATGPQQDIENCHVEWGNFIFTLATKKDNLIWSNLGEFCAIIDGRGPSVVELPNDIVRIAMDDDDLYWIVGGNELSPSRIYRRPIRGGATTHIASVGPIGSDLVVDGLSIFWKGDHRLERAPTSSANDDGKETLACDVDDFAVTNDYIYWITRSDRSSGYTTRRMKRQIEHHFRK